MKDNVKKPTVKMPMPEKEDGKGNEKKISRTWKAIQKWRGSVVVNDPTLLL